MKQSYRVIVSLFIMFIFTVNLVQIIHAISPDYVWIEGESATISNGKYVVKNNSSASGGKVITMDSSETETWDELAMGFTVNSTANYDIWVLSTACNVSYVSRFKWALDGETFANSPAMGGDVVLRTGDSRDTDMKWYKLSSQSITAGSHTFKIRCDEKRVMSPQFYYHSLDAVTIVPTSWEWTPSQMERPYNINGFDVRYVSGYVSPVSTAPEENISISVTHRLMEETIYNATLFAELQLKGEIVSKMSIAPSTSINNWQIGVNYTNMLSLNIPFNAPAGIYEVYSGFDCENTNLSKKDLVTTITVGGFAALPEMLTQETVEINLPSSITAGGSIEGSAKVKILQNVDFDTRAYLELWKDDVLWSVNEVGVVTTSQWSVNLEYTIVLNFNISDGLPEGYYELKLGLHKIKDLGQSSLIHIESSSSINKNYRPLANGKYDNRKDGTTHLWYVNQSNTLFWDGEPYIPAGGMFCSEYITRFDINNPSGNKIRWNKDLAVLETLKSKGIKDLYINPQSSFDCAPAWAWQYLMDYLDNNDFVYGVQPNAASKHTTFSGYYIRANEAVATIKSQMFTGNATAVASVSKSIIAGTLLDAGAVYAVVNNSSGAVVKTGAANATVLDTTVSFSASITGLSSGIYYAYFTPLVSFKGANMTNFWDNESLILERINGILSKLTTGRGLRMYVDPLINEAHYANQAESFRPYSVSYNAGLAEWLESKYGTIEALNTSWKTTPVLTSFADASKLIPVYTARKDTSNADKAFFINPSVNTLYTANIRNGVLWDDCIDFREISFRNFNNKAADEIKTNTDLPVVLKHVSYLNKFNINEGLSGGFDGIGCEAYGDLTGVAHDTNFSRSEVQQFGKTAWYIVTETQLDEDITRKYNSGVIGYPDKETMFRHFNNLFDYGAKGFYDFLFHETLNQKLTAYTYTSKPEMFDWLQEYRTELLSKKSIDTIVDTFYGPKPYYIYPARPAWWYYPNKRTAVLYGDDYQTLRSAVSADGRLYSHTNNINVAADVLIVNLENAPATNIYGDKFNDKLSELLTEKCVVIMGHRNNLGAIPAIDQYFTSTKKTLASGETVQVLSPPSGAEILYRTTDNLPWAFRYGNLWIFADSKWYSVSEETVTVRYMDQYEFKPLSGNIILKRPLYRDASGEYFASPVIGENISVLYLNNSAATSTQAVIIAALMNGNRLVSIQTLSVLLPGKSADVKKELTLTVPNDGNEYFVKFFVVNNLTGIKPLSFTQ